MGEREDDTVWKGHNENMGPVSPWGVVLEV